MMKANLRLLLALAVAAGCRQTPSAPPRLEVDGALLRLGDREVRFDAPIAATARGSERWLLVGLSEEEGAEPFVEALHLADLSAGEHRALPFDAAGGVFPKDAWSSEGRALAVPLSRSGPILHLTRAELDAYLAGEPAGRVLPLIAPGNPGMAMMLQGELQWVDEARFAFFAGCCGDSAPFVFEPATGQVRQVGPFTSAREAKALPAALEPFARSRPSEERAAPGPNAETWRSKALNVALVRIPAPPDANDANDANDADDADDVDDDAEGDALYLRDLASGRTRALVTVAGFPAPKTPWSPSGEALAVTVGPRGPVRLFVGAEIRAFLDGEPVGRRFWARAPSDPARALRHGTPRWPAPDRFALDAEGETFVYVPEARALHPEPADAP